MTAFLEKIEKLQQYAKQRIQECYQDILCIEPWSMEIGYGLTGICQGKQLEKAAVSISSIRGKSLPPSATEKRPELIGSPFEVSGLSIIFHPDNPFIPTAHANIRKFSVITPAGDEICWFGGGVDLTPYFPIIEDSDLWHRSLRSYIVSFAPGLYGQWKENCDVYFFNKHRNEPRGIGGVFFDDYAPKESLEKTEETMIGLIQWFLDINFFFAQRRLDFAFTQEQKEFQMWRRGRYVEFNLLYDRGTLFGLQTNGRIESILASLPKHVSWIYNGDNIFRENNDLLISELRRHVLQDIKMQKI